MSHNKGPLSGLRVVEFAGLGPTPFTAMLLADMGADVVRVERPGARALIPQSPDFLNRGRGMVELDLKSPEGIAQARALICAADALIEGMRPGVMERLGLWPDEFEDTNPRLVYGRMTGWGQTGPLAQTAGHDINYIALSGMLHAIGPADAPVPPINLVGDFGGGALYLAFGMVAALYEARASGRGQIVDGAIVDGVAHLGTMVYSLAQSGLWADARQSNLLDGGAPFYGVYPCACGGFFSVGALEPQFFAELVRLLGIAGDDLPAQHDRSRWKELRTRIAGAFASRSRDDWATIFEGSDACAAPVLSIAESYDHPHNVARGVFADVDGARQPDAAPRLSRTPGAARAEVKGPLKVEAILDRWQG